MWGAWEGGEAGADAELESTTLLREASALGHAVPAGLTSPGDETVWGAWDGGDAGEAEDAGLEYTTLLREASVLGYADPADPAAAAASGLTLDTSSLGDEEQGTPGIWESAEAYLTAAQPEGPAGTVADAEHEPAGALDFIEHLDDATTREGQSRECCECPTVPSLTQCPP